jgi:uncharacterized protein YceK
MKTKTSHHVLFLALVLFCSGCATAIIRVPIAACPSGLEEVPRIYPATTMDLGMIALYPFSDGDLPGDLPRRILVPCGGIVDLPLSIAFDTLFLPWDCYRWSQGKDWSDI